MATADGSRDTRDPEAIRAEIARARAEIASSVLALKDQVTATADWRLWVRKRPWPAIGGVFAVGLLIGMVTAPRERRVHYVIEDL